MDAQAVHKIKTCLYKVRLPVPFLDTTVGFFRQRFSLIIVILLPYCSKWSICLFLGFLNKCRRLLLPTKTGKRQSMLLKQIKNACWMYFQTTKYNEVEQLSWAINEGGNQRDSTRHGYFFQYMLNVYYVGKPLLVHASFKLSYRVWFNHVPSAWSFAHRTATNDGTWSISSKKVSLSLSLSLSLSHFSHRSKDSIH